MINPGYEERIFFSSPKSDEYNKYRIMWSENPKNKIIGDFPIHLDIEVSRYCNLKCNFCAREYMRERKKGFMGYDTFKKCFENGVPKSVKLNWLGESLYHPRIADMVRFCKSKGVLDVMINTNGIPITATLGSKLAQNGLDKLIFSCESFDKDTYESYRKGAKFDIFIRNLKYMISLREKYGNPEIRVQKVNLPELVHENEKYMMFAKLLGVNSAATNSYKEKDFTKEITFRATTCSQVYQRLMVDIDGNIHPCCGDYQNKYVIGNIKNMTIKEAWHSEKMKIIREISNSGMLYNLECCKKCEIPK